MLTVIIALVEEKYDDFYFHMYTSLYFPNVL